MHVHRRIQVECAEAALWRCLIEPRLLKEWITDFFDERPDDPAKTGLGAASTLRMKEGGKIVTYRVLVTEWQPPSRLTVQVSGGSLGPNNKADVTYELSPGDFSGQTTLDYDLEIPLRGFIFWLMSPLIRFFANRSAKRDLARLAQFAPTI